MKSMVHNMYVKPSPVTAVQNIMHTNLPSVSESTWISSQMPTKLQTVVIPMYKSNSRAHIKGTYPWYK